MPHYKNGTEARVGDHVVGVLYNSGPQKRAGTIVSITPDTESCNAMVRFTEVCDDVAGHALPRPQMAQGDPVVALSQAHKSQGPRVLVYTCEDYCAIDELEKVGDDCDKVRRDAETG